MLRPTTPSARTASDAKPWYKYLWPWLLLLGPFTVVVAGFYTGWIAFSRPDALVVGDYYKQGQAINQDLRRARAASQMELAGRIRYDAAAGRVTGNVSSHGQPYAGGIRLRLVHPTLPEKDISLEAATDGEGNFTVALPMLEMARWQVLVENASREWRLSGAWTWPQQPAIEIRAEPLPLAPGRDQ